MPLDDDETSRMERDASRVGAGGCRSGEYSANAELAEILREIMRGQRATARDVTEIKERLARGATTLDAVPVVVLHSGLLWTLAKLGPS